MKSVCCGWKSLHISSLRWFKIQLQSFPPSLQFPVHPSDSGQRVHTWENEMFAVTSEDTSNWLCGCRQQQFTKDTQRHTTQAEWEETSARFLVITWLAFPENKTGSWVRNPNRSRISSSIMHQYQTVEGLPARWTLSLREPPGNKRWRGHQCKITIVKHTSSNCLMYRIPSGSSFFRCDLISQRALLHMSLFHSDALLTCERLETVEFEDIRL